MFVMLQVAAGIVALIGLLVYHQYFRKKNVLLSLPPGPKGLPILGNILDLPPPEIPEFQHWLKFKDLYGPISSITALGQTLVIIHDRQVASDIMNKMSLKTSNRPTQVFAFELCGFQKFTSGRQYDADFRLQRKFMHQQAGTKTITAQFNGVQDVESRRLLKRAMDDPKNLIKHFRTEAAAIILKTVYGYSIEQHAVDPLTKLIETMMTNLSQALNPSPRLVDMIPALKHLPDWFPGTAFKKTAREWNKVNHEAANIPYSFVKRQMANGTNRPSFVSGLIERYSTKTGILDNDDEDAIKWTAGILYGAGSDTTVAVLTAFILAMTLFPEVQKRAQEEIDNLIGTSPTRLPQFDDRERLKYTSAILKEAFRWFTIVPITTTHATAEDFTYNGYRIPKGALLLPSVWWMHHDPQTYPDPFRFSPERFLEPRNEPDLSELFGYGRRICPGRYMADDSIFITMVRLLATFNISKAVDEQGVPMEPRVEQLPGLVSHPAGFPFSITVRSEKHEELIKSIEVDHPWEKSDADLLESEYDLTAYK
ncbi:Cytochrome P450 oxidoreductase OrdA-like protein [Trichoderma simmonsii]|uniref:Cytochrome P450 oxidoreductase OrdA-like protein n=1 Tax=Trichoderma simmonsii TaxID=1491479 RepID=A0A8G0PFZ5_9HYPO|nr:Cytochrome P450 oxidoreductase OrdA-like protein [Trichoderma simmonsii]